MYKTFTFFTFPLAFHEDSGNFKGNNENWVIPYGYDRNYALQMSYKHCIAPILFRKLDDDKPLEEHFCSW